MKRSPSTGCNGCNQISVAANTVGWIPAVSHFFLAHIFPSGLCNRKFVHLKAWICFLHNLLLNRESSVNTLTSQKPQMFTQPVTTSQKILHQNYKDETFNFKQNSCSFVVCILQNTARGKNANSCSIQTDGTYNWQWVLNVSGESGVILQCKVFLGRRRRRHHHHHHHRHLHRAVCHTTRQ
jgi:hypothetical protein